MEERDEGDGGEGGAEAGGELGDAEEPVEEGGDPEGEGRFFEPGLEVPVRDEPAGLEHLAGDLGVDAFVPVGETVVAEEGEDDEGGEESGEEGGDGGARGGCVMRLELRGHEETIREASCGGRGLGAIDLAGDAFGCGGVGAGVVAAAVDDFLGGVCAAGGGDFGGAYVSDSRGPGGFQFWV